MNDLAVLQPPPDDDGFNTVAEDQPADRLVKGLVIKFIKGSYPCGSDDGEMTGAKLCVQAAAAAWQKWVDGELVDVVVKSASEHFPGRDELDDQDQRQWPLGTDDKPRDPWQYCEFLYLADLKYGHSYTFLSGSVGGHRAIQNLLSQIQNKRQLTPGVVPMVRLDVGQFQSPRYGTVLSPKFTVTEWLDPHAPTQTAVLAEAPLPAPAPTPAPRQRRPATRPSQVHYKPPPGEALTVELDDDIPF